MTLNGVSPNRSVISANSVGFGMNYVRVVKIHQYFLQRRCRQKMAKNLVFSGTSLLAILTANYPSESVKVRHSPLASVNMTITLLKRCTIGRKLVLITKRKSYMSFRLVLKSMTLNDLERRIMAVTLH